MFDTEVTHRYAVGDQVTVPDRDHARWKSDTICTIVNRLDPTDVAIDRPGPFYGVGMPGDDSTREYSEDELIPVSALDDEITVYYPSMVEPFSERTDRVTRREFLARMDGTSAAREFAAAGRGVRGVALWEADANLLRWLTTRPTGDA